jgi:hypothetical protein
MKTKLFFLLTFLCCFAGKGFSQEARQKFISAEAGMDALGSDLLFKDNIRGDVPQYDNMGEPTQSLKNLFYKDYVGLKTEIFSLNQKLGFSVGLRYTRMHALLGKTTYSSTSTASFFYLLYSQKGTTTEYLKVKQIDQKSDYIGIPLEFRYFAFKLDPFMGYLKAGVEFDYRMQTKTNVAFYDNTMNTYQGYVVRMVGTPRSFSSVFYAAVGVRLGKPSKPCANLEINLPTVFLTPESTGLVNPQAGTGFQLSIQIPIPSKAK